jgi:hypothetical protein
MTVVVQYLALLFSGVIAGVYITGPIHDRGAEELSAESYAALHRTRDAAFRAVMPPLALATLATLVAGAVLAPTLLAAAGYATAIAALAADIALMVVLQLPLDRAIRSWQAAGIPADWAGYRDRWASTHMLRVPLGVAAFVAVIVASLAR